MRSTRFLGICYRWRSRLNCEYSSSFGNRLSDGVLTLTLLGTSNSRYARQWRYHKELSVWLTKDPGVDPIEKGPNYERGTYIIFDPAVFSRVETPKDFTLQYDLLEDRPVIVPPPALLQQVQQGQNQPQGQQQAQQTPQPSSQSTQGQTQATGQQSQEAKR